MEKAKVIECARNNGWLKDILDYITDPNIYILEKVKDSWCYLRRDYSGRDFLEPIPLNFITLDESEALVEELVYDTGIEDYDWEDMDIEEVQDELTDCLFDVLLEELEDRD